MTLRTSTRRVLLALAIVSLLASQAGCGSSTEFKGDSTPSTGGYVNSHLLISAEELDQRLGETRLTVIDPRPAGEYGQAHIPGALNVSWDHLTYLAGPNYWQLLPVVWIELGLGLRGISRDHEIVVYNDQQTGWGEDGRFFWMFSYLGHERVRVLNGGWDQWVREGRRTTTEVSPRSPTLYRVDLRPDLLADKGWMVDNLDDLGVVIIDSRSAEEYHGTVLYGEARGGHIPGAVNLHWMDTLGPDGRIRPAAELERMLGALGVSPDLEVAAYCTGGVRSGHLFFVLKLLGYPSVRNYDGSFWEWAADPSLPVE